MFNSVTFNMKRCLEYQKIPSLKIYVQKKNRIKKIG